MKMKDYLTPEQVRKHATTPKRALKISVFHWWQNWQLTKKQFELLKHDYSGLASPDMCGLCIYYKQDCSLCPLRNCDEGSLYGIVDNIRISYFGTAAEFTAWRKASKVLWKFLAEL